MDEKEKRNEKYFITVVLIFIALIIIIYLLVKDLGYINHRPLIPTGNVDIFDIIFKDKNCNCNNCNCCCTNNCPNNTPNNNGNGNNDLANGGNNSNNNNENNNDNNDGNSGNESGNTEDNNETKPNTPATPSTPTNPEDDKEGVHVFDDETEYSNLTELNIFDKTAYYVVKDKIAPASQNTYQFVIRNYNDFNIKYDMEMKETNTYGIKMRYRLKKNNAYIVGSDSDWVTYDELKQTAILLSSNNYDVYTLDWKWFESANDTAIGTQIEANYKLEIEIHAESY